jgi:hypothetical protein
MVERTLYGGRSYDKNENLFYQTKTNLDHKVYL